MRAGRFPRDSPNRIKVLNGKECTAWTIVLSQTSPICTQQIHVCCLTLSNGSKARVADGRTYMILLRSLFAELDAQMSNVTLQTTSINKT